MSTFDYPDHLTPQTAVWGLQKAGVQFRSQFAGSVESIEFPGQYWKVSITLPERKMIYGGEADAFFARLSGGFDFVRVPVWHRSVPRGTMRGTPTLAAAAVRGDQQLTISTTGGLLAGDFIGVGGQLFEVFQTCTPAGSTLIVPLVNRVRAAIASGTSVVWSRPTFTGLVPSMVSAASYRPGALSGIPVDLEEVPT